MKKITDLKGNEVIHCSTKEEANNYRNLFNYFSNKHQLLLTINDMDAIIRECGKFSRDWVPVEQSLPNNLETVWIANKKGYVNLGCRIVLEEGWHWVESNGIIPYKRER